MQHLALPDQALDRAHHVLDGHVRIDTVLVQQVDAVGAQAPQLGLDDLPDVLGAAVGAAAPLARHQVDIEAELGRDDRAVAPAALQRLAEQFLRHEGAVHLGRIEEVDAQIGRALNQRDATLAGGAAGI